MGATWGTSRAVMLNLCLPDGRLLSVRSQGEPPCSTRDAEGRPRVLGAGPLRLRCVEAAHALPSVRHAVVLTARGARVKRRSGAGRQNRITEDHAEARSREWSPPTLRSISRHTTAGSTGRRGAGRRTGRPLLAPPLEHVGERFDEASTMALYSLGYCAHSAGAERGEHLGQRHRGIVASRHRRVRGGSGRG
jgi:hypothetical protein